MSRPFLATFRTRYGLVDWKVFAGDMREAALMAETAAHTSLGVGVYQMERPELCQEARDAPSSCPGPIQIGDFVTRPKGLVMVEMLLKRTVLDPEKMYLPDKIVAEVRLEAEAEELGKRVDELCLAEYKMAPPVEASHYVCGQDFLPLPPSPAIRIQYPGDAGIEMVKLIGGRGYSRFVRKYGNTDCWQVELKDTQVSKQNPIRLPACLKGIEMSTFARTPVEMRSYK